MLGSSVPVSINISFNPNNKPELFMIIPTLEAKKLRFLGVR